MVNTQTAVMSIIINDHDHKPLKEKKGAQVNTLTPI